MNKLYKAYTNHPIKTILLDSTTEVNIPEDKLVTVDPVNNLMYYLHYTILIKAGDVSLVC